MNAVSNLAKQNSEKDGLAFLLEAFEHEQAALEAELKAAHATITHDGEMGAVIESHWIVGFLQRYLPKRYSVDSGIILDSKGKTSDQIDIVIYDNQYTPNLLSRFSHKFITAESVYAILEVKPTVNKKLLQYASNKAASVRKLHRTSIQIRHAGGHYEPKPLHNIIAGIVALKAGWKNGLKESFVNIIKELSKDRATLLDCGCTLQNGAFDVFDYDCVFEKDLFDNDTCVEHLIIREARNSLIYFLFRLLKRLQVIGTVPAVNWDSYAEVFKEAPHEA
jgi:hypothetical protein